MLSADQPSSGSADPWLAEFVSECDEHLNLARGGVLQLDSFIGQRIESGVADELFRNFHSIKGLSGMVGLRDAELLAHHMESYLEALRKGRVGLSSQGIDNLAAGITALEAVIAARRDGRKPIDVRECLSRLSELSESTGLLPADSYPPVALAADQQTLIEAELRAGRQLRQVAFTPSALLAERGINVNTVRQRLSEAGKIIHAAPRVLPDGQVQFGFVVSTQAEPAVFEAWQADGMNSAPYEPPAEPPAAHAAEPGSAGPATTLVSANSVRVDLTKLDDVMRMVGELVITRARFAEQLKRYTQLFSAEQMRSLQDANLAFERQIRDLREGVVRARLVPVREMFARMQFVVRELAQACGKQVVLHLSGQDTEFDKLVIERMMDPLLHLVRNAVSHGIESPAERAMAGKPNPASIQLRAAARGETIVIEVEDDGRGIDAAVVTRKARAAGLIADDAELDEAALLDTICLAHFSTRDQADRASGRGVGMAIVKTSVERLGGSLSLDTQAGLRTCFRIELPLTLAIADALIVSVGGQRFAVPQAAVREVLQLEGQQVSVLENNEVLSHRGGVVPLIRLTRIFRCAAEPAARPCALIVEEGVKAVGIVVDRVLGLHEVVVRPLTDPLVRVPGIFGATELGDGQVVLILDALALSRSARSKIESKRLRSTAPLPLTLAVGPQT